MINGEIVRFTNDNINNILRGQFGTRSSSAITGTTIKKIKVLAMELRRPSILRASGPVSYTHLTLPTKRIV